MNGNTQAQLQDYFHGFSHVDLDGLVENELAIIAEYQEMIEKKQQRLIAMEIVRKLKKDAVA